MKKREEIDMASKIERLVDLHGWGLLLGGIRVLCREYFDGESDILGPVETGLAMAQDALTRRCPDAPGSH